MRFNIFIGTTLCIGFVFGCQVEAYNQTVDDSNELLQLVSQKDYLNPSFQKINTEKYPTALSDSDLINVYVSSESAQDFSRIDPAVSGSGIVLNEETLIVREVFTPDNQLKLVTIMAGRPTGFFPNGGDFDYAVVSPEGSHFIDDFHGRNATCANCHLDRKNDGFLFGVDRQYLRSF